MNKNLPVEIWYMIEAERRRVFRLRVEDFNKVFMSNMFWKVFFSYRSFWRRETYFSAYTMSNVKFYHSYTHENRSGMRRGPAMIITMYLIIHFKYEGIAHYEFIKRGELGREIIQYYHPFRNE